jgi:hypothetical protein
MKLRLTLLTCGSCGKPRGRYHACAGKRGKRDRLKPGLRFACPRCGRETKNLLSHTCAPRSDFRKRKRQAKAAERRARERKRRAEAAARRKAAAKKRKAEAAARPRRKRTAAHVPRMCKDPECQRYGCLKYREGWDDGYEAGRSAGYAAGYADGREDGYGEGYTAGYAAAGGGR